MATRIKHMVDRFLTWKLPDDFSPDGGISFQKVGNPGAIHEYRHEPVGTNLLTATQAEAMIRHILMGTMVDEIPDEPRPIAPKRNDGGPAFPNKTPTYGAGAVGGPPAYPGMSLRDYFATSVDKDEYGDILYRHATQELREALAGKQPEDPPKGAGVEDRVASRLSQLDWELRVRAAIRYRMADCMLAERIK